MTIEQLREHLKEADLDFVSKKTGISVIILRRVMKGLENTLREETRLKLSRFFS